MSKIIYFTDLHARSRGPSKRSDDYRVTVMRKLTYMLDYADSISAETTVLCGGDLFDHAMVNLDVADDIIDLFESRGYRIASVFGNHDIEGGIHTATRVVLGHLMRRNPHIISLLPTLTSQVPLLVGGIQWWGHHHTYHNHLDRLEVPVQHTTNPRGIVSHSMILKEAPNFEGYSLFSDVETNVHLILLGHYHPQQKMTELKNPYNTLIGGPGALTRGSIARDDLTRKPSFAVVNNMRGEISIEFVEVEHAPASEIFDLEALKNEKAREENLTAFRENLDDLGIQKLNVAEIIESISKAGSIPEEVKEEALRRIGIDNTNP